jgi:hypothetical protein
MTTELENILDVVNRLDAKCFALPARLPLQRDHDRDGDRPTRHSIPITAPKHDHRLHRQPQPHGWNWRSKAV